MKIDLKSIEFILGIKFEIINNEYLIQDFSDYSKYLKYYKEHYIEEYNKSYNSFLNTDNEYIRKQIKNAKSICNNDETAFQMVLRKTLINKKINVNFLIQIIRKEKLKTIL